MKRIHYELIAPALWTLMVARVETALRPARAWLPVAQSPDPPKKPQQDPPGKPSEDPPDTPSPDPPNPPTETPPNTPSPVPEPGPSPVREPSPSPMPEPGPSPVREPSTSPMPEPGPFPVREPSPSPVREAPPSTVPDVMEVPGVNGSDIGLLEEQLRDALALSRTINALSRRVPWPSACMDRALALHRLMKKRGLPHTLYMGVKKNGKQKLEAHAWITAGGKVLTGGPEHRTFRPVAVYHF